MVRARLRQMLANKPNLSYRLHAAIGHQYGPQRRVANLRPSAIGATWFTID
jgi:hypothetical protein